MATYTDGSHNLLFRLTPAKWEADLRKSDKAAVVGYQEAGDPPQRRTLRAHCKAVGRGLYHPRACATPISWDKGVVTPIRGERGHVFVHGRNVNAKYNPNRYFTWVGFTHNESGKRILRINVHATAGATKPVPNQFGPALNEWKDWAITQYWLDVVAFVATQMSRECWDAIVLGGDYNGSLLDEGEWYYPGPMLAGLFVQDKLPRGLDHFMHARGTDTRVVKRWTVDKGVNSDHPLQFVTYRV